MGDPQVAVAGIVQAVEQLGDERLELAAAPVLASIHAVLIEELYEDEDDAFAAAIRS